MSTPPHLQINNLTKIFGPRSKLRLALRAFQDGANRDILQTQLGCVLAVANVSLHLDRGELLVIVGLPGSGKSTLLRCLNRLVDPTSGQVLLDGEDLLQATVPQLREVRRKQLTMVFQQCALLPHRTVVENVEYGLKIQGMRPNLRREKALETLENMGLSQWANCLPSALSGARQQRVGLARALATDAEILLMDEAFSALDPLIRREIQRELLRLQDSLHRTIVFVSQDIQEALRLGDRVVILKDGAVEQVGTPEDIVLNPVSEHVEALIREVNRAQVLKTGSIARRFPPLVQGQHRLGEVLALLEAMPSFGGDRGSYVVDGEGYPVGYVTRSALQSIAQKTALESRQWEGAMVVRFPQIAGHAALEASFPLCSWGLPVAVVDRSGRLQGVLEPLEILAHLGKGAS
ncbi:MAG: quaternary amine ABC transporter ATP-binding protein [Prochlorothrix sp.]